MGRLQTLRSPFPINQVFAAVLGFFVLANLPYYLSGFEFFPLHDTLFSYQIFYNAYNEAFYFNELPLWRPFDSYGISSDLYNFFSLGFCQYFIGVIGVLLRIKNALLLFKLSMSLEHLLLTLGAYSLCRALFRNPRTTLLICLSFVSSVFWGTQVWWNFRFYCYLPLSLFFIYRGLETGRITWLLIAGIGLMLSQPGNLPYYLGVHSSVLLLFGVLVWKIKKTRLHFVKADVGYLLILLLTALVLRDFLANATNELTNLTVGRGRATYGLNFKSYLMYVEPSVSYWLEYLRASPTVSDFSIFVGLFPFLFFLTGLFNFDRSSLFWPMAICYGYLALFSLASLSFIAPLMYYFFPLVSYIRHLPYFLVPAKPFFLLSAGFTIDAFLDSKNRELRKNVRRTLILLVVPLVLVVYFQGMVPGRFLPKSFIFLPLVLVVLFWGRTWGSDFNKKETPKNLMLALFSAEILSFCFALHFYGDTKLQKVSPLLRQKVEVSRYEYQNTRSELDLGAIPMANEYPTYPIIGNTLSHDECEIRGRIDWLPSGVIELIHSAIPLMNDHLEMQSAMKELIPLDSNLLKFLGCGVPKLAVYDTVTVMPNSARAQQAMRYLPYEGKPIVISEETLPQVPLPTKTSGEPAQISIVKFSANRMSAQIMLGDTPQGWLVYLNAFHSGWKAKVNGVPQNIMRANLGFMAIPLVQKSNLVEFSFEGNKRNKDYFYLFILASLGLGLLVATVTALALFTDEKTYR